MTFETDIEPDTRNKTTIVSRKYGTIHGFGKAAEEAQEDARQMYEHYKTKR